MSTRFSVGQMNQLGDALEVAGFSVNDVTKLRTFPGLADIRRVLLGLCEICSLDHLINLDAAPFIPPGWQVVEHKKGGQFRWDPTKVALFLTEQQKKGTIKGNQLLEELKDKPVFNANVLGYLLTHPELIPDDWKEKYTFFWGTIYRDSFGRLYVRCLYWSSDRWYWSYRWLDGEWYAPHPAALRVSN